MDPLGGSKDKALMSIEASTPFLLGAIPFWLGLGAFLVWSKVSG